MPKRLPSPEVLAKSPYFPFTIVWWLLEWAGHCWYLVLPATVGAVLLGRYPGEPPGILIFLAALALSAGINYPAYGFPFRVVGMAFRIFAGFFARLAGGFGTTPLSTSARKAETAGGCWFQRRFNGDAVFPDALGVLYRASGFLCGAYLLGVAAVYGIAGFHPGVFSRNPPLPGVLFWGTLVTVLPFIGLFRIAEKLADGVPVKLCRAHRIAALRLPSVSAWVAGKNAVLTLAAMSYLVGIYSFPSLFEMPANPHWYWLVSLLFLYLWGWWAMLFVWLFGNPRSGLFPVALHLPLRAAARAAHDKPQSG